MIRQIGQSLILEYDVEGWGLYKTSGNQLLKKKTKQKSK
jgi:hypothetical protein